MAVAQSIGNDYQLFSGGKNHRKVLIWSLLFISKIVQNCSGNCGILFVPLRLNIVDRINQKWKHATDIL